MATSDDPPQKNRPPPRLLKRHKSFGVSRLLTAISFFGPPDSQRQRACLIEQCGDTLVENKSTKTNFVNQIACKHPATSQSHSVPMHKVKGPLQQMMIKNQQSNFDSNLIKLVVKVRLYFGIVLDALWSMYPNYVKFDEESCRQPKHLRNNPKYKAFTHAIGALDSVFVSAREDLWLSQAQVSDPLISTQDESAQGNTGGFKQERDFDVLHEDI
ncbi:hypothetical protein PSTG_01147 [Puccinia striiformis f. sp. tritici PST-78]|uniref:Uncharacterized protein n=1 Tax=Puccinia striiformis f. sp. tritici PST-78 TaxID=1165861 RepID=A0A0L0W2H8_9BASI|nr:hypothetical protein PSTG_01147 [Puccinia striiformis f. sp. tritici PST-78]